ncbi:xanthine dehydrogenase family protein molybdopterin-binding subunit [Pseudogemmobacter sonorensis]|uniref:xanthine dehydrogenase family protein molybdopterin-binding subunit n=1 Tax=Pseudogemmobacter sonorensis TaxID=2989681 RepID=UPI0036B9917B
MKENAPNLIGQSVARIEDPELLTGKGSFAADNNRPGQVHMRVLRSPVAFGRLNAVEVDVARALPGVVAVWTAEDIADLPQIDFRMTKVQGLGPYRQWCLARDYVRYVGDPIAVVFAETEYLAEDACDLIFPDIDELDPQLDPVAEPSAYMPDIMPGVLSEPAVLHKALGDVDAVFATATEVIELELSVGRHSGIPLETRGALGVYDTASDTITMYGAAKVPHYNRGAIAEMLRLPLDKVQMSEGHVGGGFGPRGELYPEDVLVCHACRRLGRPVKWIEDRREHFLATNHSRDQHYRLKAAIDERGVIQALDAEFFTDQGAYVRTHGATVSDLAAALLPGPYLVPNYRVAGHIRLTNKTPCGTYRAPGRYESTFARERLIDAIAARKGLDPFEIRARNLIPEECIPYDRGIEALGTHVVYDSGKYHDLLARLRERLDWDGLTASIAARRATGERVGLGIGYFVEKSGLGPDDKVRLHFYPDGLICVVTGVANIGQGVETAMAQICAGTLGLPMEGISILHGQTRLIDQGRGAFATRVTVMTGSAIKLAAEALIEQALDLAAGKLGLPRGELRYRAGQVWHADGPTVSLRDLAAEFGPEDGLVTEGTFNSDHMTYPYGIHFAQVRLDPGTCGIHLERYLVAFDVGRAINPMLVEGQIVGAVAQGIGGALYEEFVYDAMGQPLATSFADYLMPTALEIPDVEVMIREDAPSPLNPLGAKGAGEGGITAVGAAIASAVEDAIGRPGVVDRLPITPQRVARWMQD